MLERILKKSRFYKPLATLLILSSFYSCMNIENSSSTEDNYSYQNNDCYDTVDIEVFGNVYVYNSLNNSPIVGADVCIIDDCFKTDNDGKARIHAVDNLFYSNFTSPSSIEVMVNAYGFQSVDEWIPLGNCSSTDSDCYTCNLEYGNGCQDNIYCRIYLTDKYFYLKPE